MNRKIQFWQNHFCWFIPFISEHYPLTKFQLLQYEEILDWDRIKSNPFIHWDNQTKSCFKEKLLDARKIDYSLEVAYDKMMLPNYPSANEFYLREEEKAVGKIYWKDIFFGIQSDFLPLLDQLRMNYIWEFGCKTSSFTNHSIFQFTPLTSDFLVKYGSGLEWNLLSRFWDIEWSFELLQQFEDYWVTEQLIHNHTAFNFCLKDDLDDEFIEKVLS